ncbi:MAG: hypothetical protein ACI94Y_004041 [Maribacter sp.]|jgi:hypothetical protein
MKEYKLESFTFWSKLSTNKNHILNDSSKKIQEILDKYSKEGWILSSTDKTSFGGAIYFYLYFERDLRDLV